MLDELAARRPHPPLQLSVVIPLYNEEANVGPLLEELLPALRSLARSFEVICVDDGSRDRTFAELARLARTEPALRAIRLQRNFGQTAAMSAGIEAARGEVVVPMDGDLQNDPADIGRLLERLDEGWDVVSGWRRHRRDRELGRRLPSRAANRLISAVSGIHLHDYGCSLKAYRHRVLDGVRLYGEMHRFIPVYASWQGARVTELEVSHRPRRAGSSNYGLSRTGKVLLDLLVVKFLSGFLSKPIYLFGGVGLVSLLLGVFASAWALLGPAGPAWAPLAPIAVLLLLGGVNFLLLGLLAELLSRTYYESQGKRAWLVAEEIAGGPGEDGG
jgi:glycosyltransferase involved in cell wall biosynthesis